MKYLSRLGVLVALCLLYGCEVPAGGPSAPDTLDTTPVPPPPGDTVGPPPEEEPQPDEEPTPDPIPEPGRELGIALPVNVFGLDSPVSVTRSFTLDEPADRLWLRFHRPAFRDQLKNPNRTPKASIRVNGGNWIHVTNSNFNVNAQAMQAGGIGGGWQTMRMTLDVNLPAGENTIAFRFNGTDGLSTGYRVIGINALRDGTFVFEQPDFPDPSTWTAPEGYGSQEDIQEGKDLWYNGDIVESLKIGRDLEPLSVSCAGCHAESGHDLQYFAFSNESIVNRSRFHGLSEADGKRIAAYIRSLELKRQDSTSYDPPGRPWDPPYQPSPDLGQKPPSDWAAGGGLEWVLEDDAGMWQYLTEGTGDFRGIFDAASDEDIAVYDDPIALQLADWNQWLPRMHPYDIFGQHILQNTDEIGEGSTWRDDVIGHFEAMKATLDEQGAQGLAQGANEMAHFGSAARKHYLNFLDGKSYIQLENFSGERAEISIKKWAMTKIWQEMQQHHLADDADVLYGDDAETLSWLSGDARIVFEIAPHISADNTSHFAWQIAPTGDYTTTTWYHTQMILNAGNERGGAVSPVDWNYQPMFIQSTPHPLRSIQTFAKMQGEFEDNDRPLEQVYIRQIHPGLFMPGGKYADPYDRMKPERRANAYTALLSSLMGMLEGHSESEWRAVWGKGIGTKQEVLRPATYVPGLITQNISGALHGRDFRWADGWYTAIGRFADAGVDRNVLKRMVAFGEELWPRGNWNSIDLSNAGTPPDPQPKPDPPDEEDPPTEEPPNPSSGWLATYYDGVDFYREEVESSVDEIDFYWGQSMPYEALEEDTWSIRFTATLTPQTTGEYKFETFSDDGVSLWVDGQHVLGDFTTGGGQRHRGAIRLEAGRSVPIRLEYFENTGGAHVELHWQPPTASTLELMPANAVRRD